MKLDDLKTGMIVTTRNGDSHIVMRDFVDEGDILAGISDNDSTTNSYIKLSYYKQDMKNNILSDFDIMSVYTPYLQCMDIQKKLIWEREECKEVTMKEIEEKFGCRIKIVGDDGSHCLIDKDVLVEKILNTSRKGTQNFVSAYGDGCIAREDEIMQMIEELPVVLKI